MHIMYCQLDIARHYAIVFCQDVRLQLAMVDHGDLWWVTIDHEDLWRPGQQWTLLTSGWRCWLRWGAAGMESWGWRQGVLTRLTTIDGCCLNTPCHRSSTPVTSPIPSSSSGNTEISKLKCPSVQNIACCYNHKTNNSNQYISNRSFFKHYIRAQKRIYLDMFL